MMVLLSKREYDELVQKATAADLLAEEKAEAMKKQIKDELLRLCREEQYRFETVASITAKLREILQHY